MNRALFQAPQSAFDPSFWEKLYDQKLNVLKLDSSAQQLSASITCSAGQRNQAIEFTAHSHTPSDSKGKVFGFLYNVNTVEEFKDFDKRVSLKKTALSLLSDIVTNEVLDAPSKFLAFMLLTYSDLKAYRFTYWMGAPAIIPDRSFNSTDHRSLKDVSLENGGNLCLELYHQLLHRLSAAQEDASAVGSPLAPIFALRLTSTNETMLRSAAGGDLTEYQLHDAQKAELLTLREAWADRYSPDVHLVVLDPSASASGFGWVVRNLLAAIALHHESVTDPDGATVRLVGLRGAAAKRLFSALTGTADAGTSNIDQLLRLSDDEIVLGDESMCAEFLIEPEMFPGLSEQVCAALGVTALGQVSSAVGSAAAVRERLQTALDAGQLEALNVVGWETNERGKPGPRVADLSQALDSKYLMAQAVDLNLRLMKWRLWPSLDTTRLAQTRCLLLGAGTLGCAVARALLGWGVRDITLVDNGRVSYSNPARQCLFEFEDCESRAFKATAAAARLRKIFPGVRSEGVVLSIPMPGHPLLSAAAGTTAEVVEGSEGETISEDEAQFRRLEELVKSHDVCFALTDSREARWLPTVLSAAHNKLLINVALGFDTYLVMRHGQEVAPTASSTASAAEGGPALSAAPGASRLGCYFCNDIVAATNSQRDRSLDQQCTVTRPGLSFIAAALGVELMVALMHATETSAGKGSAADGVESEEGSQSESAAGKATEAPVIPHQIRGSVAGFTQFTPHTPAFSCCTACSSPIVSAFRSQGFAFVRHACQDSAILEQTSGVAQLVAAVDVDDACFDSEDDF